jgi:biopolymer transport protein ExbD
MSHGTGNDSTVEPNLTPLLDLVLQLLMFFMICGNYASEQSNEPVNLAFSQTAKQLADETSLQEGTNKEHDFLFLTVKPYHPDTNNGDLANHIAEESRQSVLDKFKDGDAYVIIVGQDAMRADDSLMVWLKEQHDDLLNKSKDGQVHTAVVIRPDGDIDYAVVYRILRYCKDKGFTNLKVRAMIGKGVNQ